MIKKKLIMALALGGILTTLGCAIVFQQLLDKPKLVYKGVRMEQESLFEARPVFKFKVINTNPRGMRIYKISYNLKINDYKFVKGKSGELIKIKAADSQIVDLPIKFNYLDVLKTITEFKVTDKVHYEVSGKFTIGPYHIPYSTYGDFDVPAFPDITLKKIRIKKLPGKKAALVFYVDMENQNSFPVTFSGLIYSIKLMGGALLHGEKKNLPIIYENGKINMKLPFTMDFTESDSSFNEILKQKWISYEIFGKIGFEAWGRGQVQIPFNKSGRVILHR